MDQNLTTIAWRGISMPPATREALRKAGISCRPTLEIVFQERNLQWAIRGEESGGAVAAMGHFAGFFREDGRPLAWMQRVQNFMPNGVHAVIIEPALCRIEMFRYEHTYDVLVTRHSLSGLPGRRPKLHSEIVFFRRNGTLPTELWGRDAAFRGGASPRFFKRNGEEELPPESLIDALLKVTEGVCCVGCRHSHLLELGVTAPLEAAVVL